MSNLHREPSIDASYQVSVHLAKRFQGRRLKYEKLTDDRWWMPSDGKNSHCVWQGELKILIKNKWTINNWYPNIWTHPFWHIWASCFFCVQQKTHKICRGLSNEHSYYVWFKLSQWFQRRRLKCKCLRMSSDGLWVR